MQIYSTSNTSTTSVCPYRISTRTKERSKTASAAAATIRRQQLAHARPTFKRRLLQNCICRRWLLSQVQIDSMSKRQVTLTASFARRYALSPLVAAGAAASDTPQQQRTSFDHVYLFDANRIQARVSNNNRQSPARQTAGMRGRTTFSA